MPAKSKKQYNFMQGIAHGNISSIGGPSKSVAKEFVDKTPESKRKKFSHALMKGRKKSSSPMMKMLKEV